MTKARDLANIISGGFDATDIPNLDTAKITSGTFIDARLPATALRQLPKTSWRDATSRRQSSLRRLERVRPTCRNLEKHTRTRRLRRFLVRKSQFRVDQGTHDSAGK